LYPGRIRQNCRSYKPVLRPPIPYFETRYERIAVSLGKRLPLACARALSLYYCDNLGGVRGIMQRITNLANGVAEYTDEAGMVACDLIVVESRINESHLPIEETFKFLFHPSYAPNDSGTRTRGLTRGHPTSGRTPTEDDEFCKLSRIETWASSPHQSTIRSSVRFCFLSKTAKLNSPGSSSTALKSYIWRISQGTMLA
jgi:hypothetical protein